MSHPGSVPGVPPGRPRRPGSYGRAGSGLGSESAHRRYGAGAVRAGQRGERRLSEELGRNAATAGYQRWHSLRIPSPEGRHQGRYNGDVDIILASGRRIVLVDAKQWAGGHTYWRLGSALMRGWRRMPGPGGARKSISRNMELALTNFRSALPPDHSVHALVIFVPSDRGGLPSSVAGLIWPGRIRSFLIGDGLRRIRRWLGEPEEPSDAVHSLVGRMTKE